MLRIRNARPAWVLLFSLAAGLASPALSQTGAGIAGQNETPYGQHPMAMMPHHPGMAGYGPMQHMGQMQGWGPMYGRGPMQGWGPMHQPQHPCAGGNYGYPGMAMGPGMRHRPMLGGGRQGPALDADGDGIVAPDDAARRHQMTFRRLDRDGDELLSQDEFVSRGGRGFRFAPPHMRRTEQRQQRFEAIDSDQDGQLSLVEFMSAGERRFAASDLNGDGMVTVWEFRAFRPGR